MSFELYQTTLPAGAAFLETPSARKFIGVTGRFKDDEVELLRDGLNVAFVHEAPDDALEYVARDSAWPTYPGETEVEARERLEGRWDQHYWSGTKTGVLDALAALGYPGAVIYEDHDGTFAGGDWYSRFWVFVSSAHPWGALTMGGFNMGEVTMGTFAPVDVVRRFVQDVHQFRASHGYPVSVVLHFAGPLMGINTTMGSFNLGNASTCEWQIGKLFGVNTRMPFTLGGYNLGD